MKRLLIMSAFLLLTSCAHKEQPVNLPPPLHTCATVLQASSVKPHDVINADILGHLFAGALKLNGVVDHNKITVGETLQAYSDMLGCFIKQKETP